MLILVVAPGEMPEVKEISGELKERQAIVGGLIEAVYPFDEPVALICNDEGMIQHLPANRGLYDENGDIYDIICGTFFLCGAPENSEHFESLTAAQIKRFEQRFHFPEVFFSASGKVYAIPMEVL